MNTKRLFTLALVPVVIAACAKAPQDDAGGAAAELQLESDAQIYSYGVGFQIGSQMAASPLDIDAVGLMAGMRDALDKLEPRVEHERLQEVAQRVQAEMMEKQQAEQGRIAAANAEAAASFLAENAKKEGVVTLDSGLQYRVMEKAEGKKPAGTDTVEVNYRGTLVDGTEFDSSYKRGSGLRQWRTGTHPAQRCADIRSRTHEYRPAELSSPNEITGESRLFAGCLRGGLCGHRFVTAVHLADQPIFHFKAVAQGLAKLGQVPREVRLV
jgi:FKBP-type peptidyl-prolyl cis-trans isomerase